METRVSNRKDSLGNRSDCNSEIARTHALDAMTNGISREERRRMKKIGNRSGFLTAYIFNCPLDSLDEMGGSKQTSRLVAPRKEQSGQSYRSNRFGFRQTNLVRPITTGLQPKVSDFKDTNNNNPIGESFFKRIVTVSCRIFLYGLYNPSLSYKF